MTQPDFLIPKSNECERLFHGRGHFYPDLEHICIDWFAPVVLITLYKPVEQVWLNTLVSHIQSRVHQCQSIQVQHRYQKMAPVDVMWGDKIDSLTATEHGLNYKINLANNQNHGLFLDMANGRKWVIENAKNRRVVNLFSYTCAFSMAAHAGQADAIMNLDMAKAALSVGRENHKLNKQALDHVKFAGVDLFKSWGKLRREAKFDLLICDPPSFQKGSVNIERDYKKIIRRIPEFMQQGQSLLMLCLNSPDLSVEWLKQQVDEFCPECEFQQQLANPNVFKEANPDKGLKVLIYRY
ncbi:methyltransferase [Saccharobesus litoralis]|uniref:Methyltransferase n=1 Tax=Saccharobesus litoralis TaxID=2172099 RepID=A0A2S0VM35_9ALTE|nr:class I SAM-dependent methyltransferase [Saccharobesus litoralis]AWB65277.1 methyltransferase [Saccharobesus litoralis]